PRSARASSPSLHGALPISALAIEAAGALRRRGWEVSDEALRAGIRQAEWPGRFEVLPQGEGRPTFVVDGGHNPQGAHALAESLRSEEHTSELQSRFDLVCR